MQDNRGISVFNACSASEAGFSYMGILMLILIAGIGMASASLIEHTQLQRMKEQQLLFRGNAIRKAISSYYNSNPSGIKEYPPSIEALLLDKRQSGLKRHLRRNYLDPISQKHQWILVMQNNKLIGVYSESKLKPIKRSGFQEANQNFESAKTYQDWKFIYVNGIE